MGKVRFAAILAFSLLLLAACNYASLDEAIQKDIPFNIKQIVHKEKVEKGTIVFYTTRQKDGSEKFDALAAAFLTGNDKGGWENAGHNHWVYYKHEFMTQYADVFHLYTPKGKLEANIPVIFGRINSADITAVEVAGADQQFTKATIIEKGKQRYYYAVGDYKIARGLSKDGTELSRQGELQ
ncbi:hypothetical protein [Bacillus sp. T33-2]|uniref:hypothetical protein n=1 Tax=Bacillus sp. T33-2 TaxID=2054168 RepID=UPI000C794D09|nr:hypothetical protein [Bacillus sp. T33-2]PLR99829.1 hypothetical protein CVD19_01875 [Bacillus sp. T33-2]